MTPISGPATVSLGGKFLGTATKVEIVPEQPTPTEDERFLATICAEPDNVVPRLCYADWLEERDDPRGEFIRVQCELAKMALPQQDVSLRFASSQDYAREADLDDRKELALRERERNLLERYGAEWVQPVALILGCGMRFDEHATCGDLEHDWRIRRGFIEELSLPFEDWVEHASQLRAVAPVRKVHWTSYPVVTAIRPFFIKHADHIVTGLAYGQSAMQFICSQEWPGIQFSWPEPPPCNPVSGDMTFEITT